MDKVLIVGSGGREHALGWKIDQSDTVSEVFYAPGNGGTQEGKGRNILIDGTKKSSFQELFDFVMNESVDLVVVGPEAPLANGVVDYFNERGYDRIFGPTKNASLLESDKFYSADLMQELGIPQAHYFKCHSLEEAVIAIKDISSDGIVVKARGLASGKGVEVYDSKEQALDNISSHVEKHGEVLISQRLYGEEFSLFGISDGNRVYTLELVLQDYKRLLDGDQGPNTGGMGAYGPADVIPKDLIKNISDRIMTPIVCGMKDRGSRYAGFIYGGFMMTEEGPKVLEFNARFGDPECQPAMMLLKNDLYELLSLSLGQRLDEAEIEFNPGAACCVILASKGYPDNYEKGFAIHGLERAGLPGVKIFHSGTKRADGGVFTSAGRVLGVTAYSPNGIKDARRLAYESASRITTSEGFHYRTDIASKALNKIT